MKRKGSTLDYERERADDLAKAFREAWKQTEQMTKSEIVAQSAVAAKAVLMPAAKFWVSEERACDVVSKMRRGLPVLAGMMETKRRMYCEIARRVDKELEKRPLRPLLHVVADVLEQPAPEFYMLPSTAVKMMQKRMRQRRGR